MSTEHQGISGRLREITSEETERMFSEKIYERPEDFFIWVEETVRKLRVVRPGFYGNEIALSVCDRIDQNKDLDPRKIFGSLIEYGGTLGLKSEVQNETYSIRYTATVVLSMYLEKKGLAI